MLQEVLPAGGHRLVGHPDDHGVDVVGAKRLLSFGHEDVAAADIDLIGEREGDGAARSGHREIAVHRDDAVDGRRDARWQADHLVTGPDDARCDGASKAPEVEIGPGDHLNRQAEGLEVDPGLDIDRLKMLHHRRPVEPRQVVTLFDDVVAEQSRHGQEHRVDQVERLREFEVLLANFVEALLAPIDEIHLVDRDGDVANPEEVGDVAVPFGLGDDPMARVDQDDRKLTGRRAGDHVACVLLVARRVGDDELSLRRGEVSIGDVDRDALLPLGLEAVGEQRKVDLITGAALGGGVGVETRELIFVDHVRVVQKAADQG